jgi:hypothetical protein
LTFCNCGRRENHLAPKRRYTLADLLAQCDLKAAPAADLALCAMALVPSFFARKLRANLVLLADYLGTSPGCDLTL